MAMYYITGDTHGGFSRIQEFCLEYQTNREDVLIILGDAAINYDGGRHDQYVKNLLSTLPITIFSIHGNHEQRPETIPSYQLVEFHGALAYWEKEFPNIYFGKDGEVYDFAGNTVMCIGGAYSVDKEWRLQYGYSWWPDEQPSKEIREYVEK